MNRPRYLLLGTCLVAALAAAQETVDIKAPGEVESHEISVRNVLPVANYDSDGWPLKWVRLQITVGPDGSVISAKPLQGYAAHFKEAADAALQWRFTPFKRDGRSVNATFQATMQIVPPEKRLNGSLPMPAIRDWNSLQISLARTICLGMCPQYNLTVYGDGSVQYDGESYTKYCGEWRGTIPQSKVHELVAQFRAADYFSLYPEYVLEASDIPGATTYISFDNEQRQVVDSEGEQVGMPGSVLELERAIDRLAGPEHWTTRRKLHPGVDTSCDSMVPTGPENPLPDSIPSKTSH